MALAACVAVFAPARVGAAPPAPPTAPDPAAKDASRAAFRDGVVYLRSQRWVEARRAFEKAHALYPHVSILLNRGIARQKTGDPALAEQDFLAFLSEDTGAAPEELASARDALAEVRAVLGTLRIEVVPRTARIRVDDVDAQEGTARVLAGRHVVEVTADAHTPVRREVEVTAREEVPLAITLAPLRVQTEVATEPDEARTVLGLGAAGLGAVALGLATFSAFRASSLADDYADPASTRFQDRDVRAEGVAYRTTADVALGVAVLSGAAAVVLLATDLGGSRRRPASAAARGALLRW